MDTVDHVADTLYPEKVSEDSPACLEVFGGIHIHTEAILLHCELESSLGRRIALLSGQRSSSTGLALGGMDRRHRSSRSPPSTT